MLYNLYEFFAGGGMARLGVGDRWKCIFANELCAKKAAAYRAHFGPSPELKIEDVARLTAADLPGRADLVWASFPCKDVSLAGPRAGLAGNRSGTFWPFWRLMEELISERRKPTVIVLENVTGLISSHKGADLTAILASLAAAGYCVGVLVIDAARFVPQSRERIFIVAVDVSVEIPPTLLRHSMDPIWHTNPLTNRFVEFPSEIASKWVWWSLPMPTSLVPPLSVLLEAEPTDVRWDRPHKTRHELSLMDDSHRDRLREVQACGERRIGAAYRRTRPDRVKGRKQRLEARFDGIAGCLRFPGGGSSRQKILVVDGPQVRSRLPSRRELARLMGVPEDYLLPKVYNEAYGLFGDGVVVPVVAWLEQHLLWPLVQVAAAQPTLPAPSVDYAAA